MGFSLTDLPDNIAEAIINLAKLVDAAINERDIAVNDLVAQLEQRDAEIARLRDYIAYKADNEDWLRLGVLG